MENSKKSVSVLWWAFIGWLTFVLALSAGNSMEDIISDFGVIGAFSLPGALIGVIIGKLTGKKIEKKIGNETLESKIKGLKNLLDEGLLTQEEFDEQKKKVLNS